MKDISASCVIKMHTVFNPNHWYKLFNSIFGIMFISVVLPLLAASPSRVEGENIETSGLKVRVLASP